MEGNNLFKYLVLFICILFTFEVAASDLESLKITIEQRIKDTNYDIGVYVMELETGKAIGINQNQAFRPASLIKAALIPEIIERMIIGEFNLDDEVLIRKELVTYSRTFNSKSVGSSIPIRKLLFPCFCLSDNLAANLLADYLELDNINLTMHISKAFDTQFNRIFSRSVGKGTPPNKITAANAGKLFRDLYNGLVNLDEYSKYFVSLLKKNVYRWGIVAGTPKKVGVAHIVGMNSKVMNDAGVVFLQDNPYVISVLINNYKNKKHAQRKIAEIAHIVYQHFSQSDYLATTY